MGTDKSLPVRLSESERTFLKARIDVDIRSSGTIAQLAAINPGAMVDAVAGNRSMRSRILERIQDLLGIDHLWRIKTDVPHLIKINADLAPLHVILSRLKDPELWWVPPVFAPASGLDMESQAPKTYFAIRTPAGHLLLVDRDPWRVGTGKKALIAPEDALPLTPGNLEGLKWGGGTVENSRLDIRPADRLTLDRLFILGVAPEKQSLVELLFGEPDSEERMSWDDVVTYARNSGVTPAALRELVDILVATSQGRKK